MKPFDLTIHDARDLLNKGELSSVELTDSVLERLAQLEPRLNAFVTVTEELARRNAREADHRRSNNEEQTLTGIPMQIKDLICTKGVRTTCASKMLEEFVPIYDATVIEKLNLQSPVLIGKGNMDEFAMGSSTENSAFSTTKNPWDLGRVPGGSSGGSAAAVASGLCAFALGSDTGGSIRQPAALCGVTGLKPTYGLVSRYGLIAFASSLDQIGPLTKDVEDCALVLNAISGHDVRDSTSIPGVRPDYSKSLIPEVKGLRLGLPKEYFDHGIHPKVVETVKTAIAVLEENGAIIEECSLPLTPHALPVYYIIAPAECSANLARYDGVKYGYAYQGSEKMWEGMEKTRQHGFGPEVKRRILLGAYALSTGYYDEFYLKALKVRTLIREEFERVFKSFDALITPTSPTVAFPIGEKVSDPVAMYQNDICTLPANIAGIPAISIPCGFVDGLPVGMQVMGPAMGEETILQIAYTYQQYTSWHTCRPAIDG